MSVFLHFRRQKLNEESKKKTTHDVNFFFSISLGLKKITGERKREKSEKREKERGKKTLKYYSHAGRD